MLDALGVGFGVVMIAPQLTQPLSIGICAFIDERVDRIITLFDDTIPPAFGPMVVL